MPIIACAGGASGRTPWALACAANMRSAGSPWRSPFPSFLYAYCTDIARSSRVWPCMFATASSAASKEA